MLDHKTYQNQDYDIYRKIKEFFANIVGAFWFFLENYRKRYPYILVGEKNHTNSSQTILLYRQAGKRFVFEMPAKEICNTKNLIKNFHPLDVRVISYIAGVEQILELPTTQRKPSFNKLKKKVFNHLL